jgi:AcrR family transcriptional regulator
MPKISDEKRAIRQRQILDAALTCFQKNGLQATTMDDIIRASGLSAGAVYSYFASKDDLIHATVTASLSSLRDLLEPLLSAQPALSPAELLLRLTETIDDFTVCDGYDLKRIALHGWSEAQSNERLRVTMRNFYLDFRDRLAGSLGRWGGHFPEEKTDAGQHLAKALLSMLIGFVVQSVIIGDVEPEEIAHGIAVIAKTLPASANVS